MVRGLKIPKYIRVSWMSSFPCEKEADSHLFQKLVLNPRLNQLGKSKSTSPIASSYPPPHLRWERFSTPTTFQDSGIQRVLM